MSDLNVSSQGATVNFYYTTPVTKPVDPTEKDGKSSDLDSARTSLATLQQNMAGALSNPAAPTDPNATSLLASHVKEVIEAVASGDVSAAPKLPEDEESAESAKHLPDDETEETPQEVIYSATKGTVSIPVPTGQRFSIRA